MRELRIPIIKQNNIQTKKNKLRTVNKVVDSQHGIMLRWNVHFDSYDKPFVNDVNCFCLKHSDLHIKFIFNKCPDPTCVNSEKQLDTDFIENYVESIVLDEWDKINGTKI